MLKLVTVSLKEGNVIFAAYIYSDYHTLPYLDSTKKMIKIGFAGTLNRVRRISSFKYSFSLFFCSFSMKGYNCDLRVGYF